MNSQEIKICEVSDQVRGVTYGAGDAIDTYRDGYCALLRANNIKEAGLDFEDLIYVPNSCVNEKQILRHGDILIAASSGSLSVVGKAAIFNVKGRFTFGAFCKVIRPKENIHKEYLGNYFRTREYRQIVSSLAAGANINNLRNEHIDNLILRLPPLAEQKRIAELLDTADRILRLRESAIAKLDELAQSVFVEITSGSTKNKSLKDIANFQSGGTPSKENSNYWDGDIDWISSADIIDDVIQYGRNKITSKGLAESATNLAKTGSILFVTRTGIGKVAITDRDTAYSQDIVEIQIQNNYEKLFIVFALKFNKVEFMKQARGATIKGITKEVLGSAKVPLISYSDQLKFAKIIDEIMIKRDRLVDSKKYIKNLISSLQHQSFAVN